MIVEVLGGLGVKITVGKESLLIDPPFKVEGALYTGSYPFGGEPSPPGERGPFRWKPVTFPGLRGSVTGYLIEVGSVKLLHTGGLRYVDKPVSADVLTAPAGGVWYLDPKEFCELVKKSEVKVAIPLAVWYPGIKLPFEGLEEVKVECRGLRRVRARRRWKVEVNTLKKTIALVSPS